MQITSLVTGGAGFIGSYVAEHLLEMGHKVVVLDDLSGGFLANVPEAAQFIEGSITDSKLINQLFEEHQFDYVYHFAAYAAEGLSHFIRQFNYENNLMGSINLINASVNFNVKCFVFTSSIAVYGHNELPFVESQAPQPTDPYGIAKFAVELDLKNALEVFGLNHIIFRPHNVYGQRQNIGDKYRNVLGIFMNQALKRKPLTIFGDGEQTRAFTYVEDIAPIMANAVNVKEAYNEVFNIGADQFYTVNQIADQIMETMMVTVEKEFLTARKEVIHAYADHTKYQSIFNPNKPIDIKEGIASMGKWVKQMGARASNEFEAIEIEKNLPKTWLKSMKNEG